MKPSVKRSLAGIAVLLVASQLGNLQSAQLAQGFAGVSQDPSYTFTAIDVPGAAGTFSGGINARRQIVGTYQISARSPAHGFVYDGSVFVTLDVPPSWGPATQLYGINDRGQIVGSYNGEDLMVHGFVYENGDFTSLDVPGASRTDALGINNHGEIVGRWEAGAGGFHGFLYSRGEFVSFDVPFAGATSTVASGINARGEIVGGYMTPGESHGFLYKRGQFFKVDAPLPDIQYFGANAINNRGHIAGGYVPQSGPGHGFLYKRGTFVTVDVPLDLLPINGGQWVSSINARGDLLGQYYDDSGGHVYLATRRGKGRK
jgi:probable HAF family extracellular repeat protein